MSTFFDSISQKKRFLPAMQFKEGSLPISQTNYSPIEDNDDHHHMITNNLIGLRRRMSSSFSVRIQLPHQLSSAASSAWPALRRSKSMSSLAEFAGRSPLKRWWDRSLGWILSRKPTFAGDLEMNDEETRMLGCHCRGSLRHVFYRVRSEIRKLVRPSCTTLPTTLKPTFKYDSFSYAQNFDDGNKLGDE